MRVKLDENLPVQLKQLFLGSGHDAATAADESLGGAPDAAIAFACAGEGRTLVTLDLDFADTRAYPPGEYPGIVVLRMPRATRDAVLRLGKHLLERLSESSPNGQLWIVEDSRIRIRE